MNYYSGASIWKIIWMKIKLLFSIIDKIEPMIDKVQEVSKRISKGK